MTQKALVVIPCCFKINGLESVLFPRGSVPLMHFGLRYLGCSRKKKVVNGAIINYYSKWLLARLIFTLEKSHSRAALTLNEVN